jgi:hypothetical protein
MAAAAMRDSQGCRCSSLRLPVAGQGRGQTAPDNEKRPLARQRPKSREETPKEGGGNADALPHGEILGTGSHKMQGANHRLLTYSRTSLGLCPSLPSPAAGVGSRRSRCHRPGPPGPDGAAIGPAEGRTRWACPMAASGRIRWRHSGMTKQPRSDAHMIRTSKSLHSKGRRDDCGRF